MVGKTIYYPCLYNKYFFHGVITITIHNIRSLKVQFMIVIFKLGYYSYAFFSTLGKATLCTRGDSYECETLETHQSCVSNAGCDVTASNALRKNACDQGGCCLQCFKSCIKCSKFIFLMDKHYRILTERCCAQFV